MTRKCLVLAIVGIVAILGAYSLSNSQGRETADNSVAGLVGARNSDVAVRDYLDKLGSMEACEILGTWDVGDWSYGRYCFRRSTLLEGIKELKLYPYAEPQELENFLGDTWTQEKILISWIKEDPKILEKQFHTSVVKRGLGLPNL